MKKFLFLLSLSLIPFYVFSQNVSMCVLGSNDYEFLNSEKILNSDDEYTSNDPFNNILGLRWGMNLNDAILKLKELGLSEYETSVNDNGLSVLFNDNVYWDGMWFNHLTLNSFVSNRQQCYLSEIIFSKNLSDIIDAKNIFEQVAVQLRWRFGVDMVKKDFKGGDLIYYIEEDLKGLVMPRVILGRSEYHQEFGYIIALKFNGYMEASKRVYDDR